jgi:DNA-binding beta-propeller fold protein YncE
MRTALRLCLLLFLASRVTAGYVNVESSHVHPLTLTPSGSRLLAVNTPDALLEVFAVQADGGLFLESTIPVGLEPVTVRALSDNEAWVVNNLSDTISVVDLNQAAVMHTLHVGDEPTDVVFAGGRAFVTVSSEDAVKVYELGNLAGAPTVRELYSRDVRALATSPDGQKVYAVTLRSGNQTTVINATVVGYNTLAMNPIVLSQLVLGDSLCRGADPPPYPPLPEGIESNQILPGPGQTRPPLSLIVRWDNTSGRWLDEAGQDWTHCVHYRLPDRDLFVIDVGSLEVSAVSSLGTSLFDVSVHPGNGKIYVPNTEARNFVRFEHALGLQGHFVDNRLSIVDPAAENSVTVIELNSHIDRSSKSATNLAEREASVSQPGMMTWRSDGSVAYITAIGSGKVFRVDGSCLAEDCIFGPERAQPNAVDVGLGPTGVALREAAQPEDERLYVLNRIAHSVSVLRTSPLGVVDEIALHDPTAPQIRDGRRFLYDAVSGSAHGDGACSSCHLFGDADGLAWELGNPELEFVSYDEPFDNVRFTLADGKFECSPPHVDFNCRAHTGFDPQKGPMLTPTLRGLLEPLHWRGDRATFEAFNSTFVSLMGALDVGPIDGRPAGIPETSMDAFAEFARDIRFPPNPFRAVDDSTPCGPRATDPDCQVRVHGAFWPGNPTEGVLQFREERFHEYITCRACHRSEFGTFGGVLGGTEPTEPTSADAVALHNGSEIIEFAVPHSDIKIPHLRNLYEKFGPFPADPFMDPPDVTTGFGYTHDGSIPDLVRFLTANGFEFDPANAHQQIRDTAISLFFFPTGTKPSVGRQVTLAAGPPPSGSPPEEALLASLSSLGDAADPDRHCELVVATHASGRPRQYRLSAGAWLTDVAGEDALTTLELRESAQAPLTFTCGHLGSGPRLGGDRDEDGALNGDDCASANSGAFALPGPVTDLTLDGGAPTALMWGDQAQTAGTAVAYDVLGGTLSALRDSGTLLTACVEADLTAPSFADARPDPAPGDGYYYLIRAEHVCGAGDVGPGRDELLTLACP